MSSITSQICGRLFAALVISAIAAGTAFAQADFPNRPIRVKSRPPSFYACQAMSKMVVGGLIADVVAVIGSTDIVLGDVDR